MKNKYLIFQDEIVELWNTNHGYTAIAEILIANHNLEVTSNYLRKQVAKIIKTESLVNDLSNVNHHSALNEHLKERGINKEDVISVKHWQSMNGELRFSIVTKEKQRLQENELLEKIKDLIEDHNPYW